MSDVSKKSPKIDTSDSNVDGSDMTNNNNEAVPERSEQVGNWPTKDWSYEAMESFDFVNGIAKVHNTDRCAPEFCCIHNPSDHPLKDAPMLLRTDRGCLVERICPHRVGHDDPDSIAYLRTDGIHGCDGCCGVTSIVDLEEQLEDSQENARGAHESWKEVDR